MSERTRSHNQQQTRRNPQVSSSQSTSHHQYHPNNRSIYHGHHQVDTYSTSNYRHPSTTTTNTDPSSITLSQTSNDNCGLSIFYSYLVAIISSFLVVLGIYLSLTKFNVRFLYISLLGFSIEAIGACIYCISNIRSSQSAKRKQRISSNEFILQTNGQGNIDNNLRRQEQITTITHILNNRTLNPNSSNNNNDNNIHLDENVPSAINNDNETQNNPSTSVSRSERPTVINDNNSTPLTTSVSERGSEIGGTNENSIVVISNQNQHSVAGQDAGPVARSAPRIQGSSIDQMPMGQRCQPPQSPEGLTGDYSSSTDLLGNQQNSLTAEAPTTNVSEEMRHLDSDERDMPSQLSINLVSEFNNSQLGDKNITKINTRPKDENDNLDAPDGPAQTISPLVSHSASLVGTSEALPPHAQGEFLLSNEDSPDLINLQQGTGCGLVASDPIELQVAKRRLSGGQQQRQANIRRTLVMGLSGEEEEIEIDEEDLDNMSIFPPSYESVATNTRLDNS